MLPLCLSEDFGYVGSFMVPYEFQYFIFFISIKNAIEILIVIIITLNCRLTLCDFTIITLWCLSQNFSRSGEPFYFCCYTSRNVFVGSTLALPHGGSI